MLFCFSLSMDSIEKFILRMSMIRLYCCRARTQYPLLLCSRSVSLSVCVLGVLPNTKLFTFELSMSNIWSDEGKCGYVSKTIDLNIFVFIFAFVVLLFSTSFCLFIYLFILLLLFVMWLSFQFDLISICTHKRAPVKLLLCRFHFLYQQWIWNLARIFVLKKKKKFQ